MAVQIRCGNYGLQAVCVACEQRGCDVSHLDMPMPVSVRSDGDGTHLVTYPVELVVFCREHESC